jgi:hypothetical protein
VKRKMADERSNNLRKDTNPPECCKTRWSQRGSTHTCRGSYLSKLGFERKIRSYRQQEQQQPVRGASGRRRNEAAACCGSREIILYLFEEHMMDVFLCQLCLMGNSR